jgi:hypothetical protein
MILMEMVFLMLMICVLSFREALNIMAVLSSPVSTTLSVKILSSLLCAEMASLMSMRTAKIVLRMLENVPLSVGIILLNQEKIVMMVVIMEKMENALHLVHLSVGIILLIREKCVMTVLIMGKIENVLHLVR